MEAINLRSPDGQFYIIPGDVAERYRVQGDSNEKPQPPDGGVVTKVGDQTFAVPGTELELHRVPAERAAELESQYMEAAQRQLGDEAANQDDVSGYMYNVLGYTVCWYASIAGGASAVGAQQECMAYW